MEPTSTISVVAFNVTAAKSQPPMYRYDVRNLLTRETGLSIDRSRAFDIMSPNLRHESINRLLAAAEAVLGSRITIEILQ